MLQFTHIILLSSKCWQFHKLSQCIWEILIWGMQQIIMVPTSDEFLSSPLKNISMSQKRDLKFFLPFLTPNVKKVKTDKLHTVSICLFPFIKSPFVLALFSYTKMFSWSEGSQMPDLNLLTTSLLSLVIFHRPWRRGLYP